MAQFSFPYYYIQFLTCKEKHLFDKSGHYCSLLRITVWFSNLFRNHVFVVCSVNISKNEKSTIALIKLFKFMWPLHNEMEKYVTKWVTILFWWWCPEKKTRGLCETRRKTYHRVSFSRWKMPSSNVVFHYAPHYKNDLILKIQF